MPATLERRPETITSERMLNIPPAHDWASHWDRWSSRSAAPSTTVDEAFADYRRATRAYRAADDANDGSDEGQYALATAREAYMAASRALMQSGYAASPAWSMPFSRDQHGLY